MAAFIIPALIAGAASGVAAWMAGAAATFAFSWAAFGVTLALGALGAMNKSKAPSQSLDIAQTNRLTTVRQAAAPWAVVFGECRVGGVMAHLKVGGEGRLLWMVVVLAGHEVDAIGRGFANNILVDESGGWGAVVPAKFSRSLGDPDQAANAEALIYGNDGEWTADHRLRGRAYVFLQLHHMNNAWEGGIPNLTWMVRGYNQIYDPRDSVTGYSNNPALCVAAYLCNTSFGLSADYATEINETALIAAANICDEAISEVHAPAFTVTAGSPGPGTITWTAEENRFTTGDAIILSSTGTLPAPFSSFVIYYLIKVDTLTAKLASTYALALAGTGIEPISAGSGTHTAERVMTIEYADPALDTLRIRGPEKRLLTGDGVRIYSLWGSPQAVPLGLNSSTTYYVRVVKTIQVPAQAAVTGGWVNTPWFDEQSGALIREWVDADIPAVAAREDVVIELYSTYVAAVRASTGSPQTCVNFRDSGNGALYLKAWETPRYTCNGSFLVTETPKAVIEGLCSSMGGSAVNIGGKWTILAGAYITPTGAVLTPSEIVGPMEVTVLASRADTCNGVKGVFISPEHDYQPTDLPAVTSSTYYAEDGNERIWREIELSFTTRTDMARRLAKLELERSRQALTVKVPCMFSAFRFQTGNTLTFTFSKYGWSAKTFEVIDSNIAVRDDGVLGYDMVLRETASAVYDWTVDDDSVEFDRAPNTDLPTRDAMHAVKPPAVSGLQLVDSVSGNDLEFAGKHAKFKWRAGHPFAAEFGAEEVAGPSFMYLRDFEILIIDPTRLEAGTWPWVMRREFVKDTQYTYTYEFNLEDNASYNSGSPLREFTFLIRQWTRYEKTSDNWAGFTVSNPAPVITDFALTAIDRGFSFAYTCGDTDFERIAVYASLTSGFTPSTATLVYQGSKRDGVVGPLLGGRKYYVTAIAHDVFGAGSAIAETSVITYNDAAVIAVSNWSSVDPGSSDSFYGAAWSAELSLFAAVSYSGSPAGVMTSIDGRVWTERGAPASLWRDVCWGSFAGSPTEGIFVAVGQGATSAMTSTNGTTWTGRTVPVSNGLNSVCFAQLAGSPSQGLFVAVAENGTGTTKVATSPDGITWTARSAASTNAWRAVCWSPELQLFCAVAYTGSGDQVMTSPDGITWTARTTPGASIIWRDIAWSPMLGLFAVVGGNGYASVMTSSDGITWALGATPTNSGLSAIEWAADMGLFVALALAYPGYPVISRDGLSWVKRGGAESNSWESLAWSAELGLFVAVGGSTDTNQMMISQSYKVTDL